MDDERRKARVAAELSRDERLRGLTADRIGDFADELVGKLDKEPESGRMGVAKGELRQLARNAGTEMSDEDSERLANQVLDIVQTAGPRTAAAPGVGNGRVPPTQTIKLAPTAPPEDRGRRSFWKMLRNRSDAIGFPRYSRFIDTVLCCEPQKEANPSKEVAALTREAARQRRDLTQRVLVYGPDAYNLLRLATDSFLMQEAGVLIPESVTRDKDGKSQRTILAALTKDETGSEVDGHLPRTGKAPAKPTQSTDALKEELRRQYLEKLGGEASGSTLPFFGDILEKLKDVPLKSEECLGFGGTDCYGILRSRAQFPVMLELIWSYWMEESGLVQSLKAISMRFQNKRAPGLKNPLERFALDPIRPLSNLLWGFVEDESSRLSLTRRAYEYDQHYGITIEGRAVEALSSIDSRKGFLEAFHTLLNLCSTFFRELDDNTVTQDGFPVLNGLKEVHLSLAEGMHNQYGDLPWEARKEMLMMQWLMARPEMREFLGSRPMLSYREAWMGRVETMRRLQGWGHKPISHFRDLAVFGEILLLSIRFTDWVDVDSGETAADWAAFFRTEIQSYIHAYRSLTGVDLASDSVNYQAPARLLRQDA